MKTLDMESVDRLLVFAVHPDDEILSSAGLIQRAKERGCKIKVVLVTDGENNPWPQRVVARRLCIDDELRERWRRRRRNESLAALASLGIGPECVDAWSLPDLGLDGLLVNQQPVLQRSIEQVVATFHPSHVIGPFSADLHPDHNALAVALDGWRLSEAMQGRCPLILAYLLHGSVSVANASSALYCISLDEGHLRKKREAIRQFQTQMVLSSRRFLGFAKPLEVFVGAFVDQCHGSRVVVDHEQRTAALVLELCRGDIGLTGARFSLVFFGCEAHLTHYRLSLYVIRSMAVMYDRMMGHTRYVRIQRSHSRVMINVALPYEVVMGPSYIKREGKRFIFDRDGWHGIPHDPMGAGMEGEQKARGASIVALIPCYNVEALVEPVVRKTLEYVDRLLVFDDGSTDGTYTLLTRLASQFAERIILIGVKKNRGKGWALLDGFRYAIEHLDADFVVTLDGDGQHDPANISDLLGCAEGGGDLVIGGRDFSLMPLRSRIGNTAASGLLRLFFPHAPRDMQSGLRVHSRRLLNGVISQVKPGRYETEVDIICFVLCNGFTIGSVSIPTIYIDGNASSHFRPLVDSWRVLRAIFKNLRRAQEAGAPLRNL